MKLVYMGSPKAAVAPLEYLLNSQDDIQVVAVISQAAKPVGRNRVPRDPPVAELAKRHGLKVFQPDKVSGEEFLVTLRQLAPDVVVTCAYGQILSSKFLEIPKRATINIHPSILPAYRGATPVQSALLDGVSETGVTILFTVKALDAGNIIAQKSFAVGSHENSDELLTRLFKESGPMLVESLERLSDPTFIGTPQDPALVTHCKKFSREDGQVQWHMDGQSIINRYRAFQPWPGAFSFLDGKRIALADMAIREANSGTAPGRVVFSKTHQELLVAASDVFIGVGRLCREGGKFVSAQAFWNGLRHKDGLIFAKES